MLSAHCDEQHANKQHADGRDADQLHAGEQSADGRQGTEWARQQAAPGGTATGSTLAQTGETPTNCTPMGGPLTGGNATDE